MKRIAGIIGIGIWLGSCTVLTREDPDKKVRAFINEFRLSLGETDEELLKFFRTSQTREELLKALNLLRNTDTTLIICQPSYIEISIERFGEAIAVTLPTIFKSVSIKNQPDKSAKIVFWLESIKDGFMITELDGNDFYREYTSFKTDHFFVDMERKLRSEREPIYKKAKEIGEAYDSVIWYTSYLGKTYFYVVNGVWNEKKLTKPELQSMSTYKMGLVDEEGNEIIPPKFELIGSLGSGIQNTVEVKGDSGYGIYSLDGIQLIVSEFSENIPYQKSIWISHKSDGYFYLDSLGKLNHGFPDSLAEKHIKSLQYLSTSDSINYSTFSFCEYANPHNPGFGIWMPPSYWVNAGFYNKVETGFSMSRGNYRFFGGWKDYIVTEKSIFEKISEDMLVAVIHFKERFLEGRAEFYYKDRFVFTDENQNIVGTYSKYSEGDNRVKKINERLIEVSDNEGMTDESGLVAGWGGIPPELQVDGRSYTYLAIGDSVKPIRNSNRFFNFTQFVLLDSSYITGNFMVCLNNDDKWEAASTMPLRTLVYMRDEILADNGLAFPEGKAPFDMVMRENYHPRFQTEAELEPHLSDIDRYNLQFLARAIERYKQQESM